MLYTVRLVNKATGAAYSGEVDVPDGASPALIALDKFGEDHLVGRVYPVEHPTRTGFVDDLIEHPIEIDDEGR